MVRANTVAAGLCRAGGERMDLRLTEFPAQ
jgi:hypothetical protein